MIKTIEWDVATISAWVGGDRIREITFRRDELSLDLNEIITREKFADEVLNSAYGLSKTVLVDEREDGSFVFYPHPDRLTVVGAIEDGDDALPDPQPSNSASQIAGA